MFCIVDRKDLVKKEELRDHKDFWKLKAFLGKTSIRKLYIMN